MTDLVSSKAREGQGCQRHGEQEFYWDWRECFMSVTSK